MVSTRSATLPSQFVEENIGGTWSEAVGLVFAPDGRMFVWERGGRVWTVENGVRSAQPILDVSEEVAVWNNYGMLGFCLHPDFNNNGYIYLLYVADRHHVRFFGTPNYDPEETETHVATIGRITRYTARAEDGYRSVDPASRLVLVGQGLTNGFPLISGQHGVGTILFGTDGTLLASCGDGASSSITDVGNGSGTYYAQALADGIIRPAENVGAYRCQLVDSLNGKIIRIDPATGDGLPSNPFFDPDAPRRPASRVWAMGLKTPSRLTLRPGTGEHHPSHGDPGVLYIGDVGWNEWEDLNICDRPGLNFGWPAYEGMEIQPDYYNSNVANLDAPNPVQGSNGCNRPFFYFRELIKQATLGTPSWPNPCNPAQQIPASIPRFLHARPAIDWGHSGPARVAIYSGTNAATINVGASGSPVAGASFSGACSMGGVWYTATNFPAPWRDTYFHFDYEAQSIKSFVFDTNQRPVEVRNFATSAGGVVYLTQHPTDGSLYYITWDSTVRRIRYVPSGNLPPLAVATQDRAFGPGPLTVRFTGTNSTDPENLPLSFQWNFGDGTALDTNASPTHVFTAPSGVPTRYNVTLRVTDRSGATNSTGLIVSVNNSPPVVSITGPTNGSLYPMTGDSTWPCTATVTDAQHSAGQLTYAWQTFLHHNNHLHSEPVDTNRVTTTTLSPEGCDGQTYFYRVVLIVTDPAGLSTTNESRLYPDCAGYTRALAFQAALAALSSNRPPSGNFDLSHWYVTLPEPGAPIILAPQLSTGYTHPQWFYTDPDGAMVFWCPVNGGTTSGSSYPRTELRETLNPTNLTVNWPAVGTHILEAQCIVRRLPSTGKVIIGQIHSYLGEARPLVKLLFDNGAIDAQVKESPTDDPDQHLTFPNTPLNSVIAYRIEYKDGLLTLTVNGQTQSVDMFALDPAWASQEHYFKAGSYVQDNEGSSSEGGRVDFYQLVATHQAPVAPPSITSQPASRTVPLGTNVSFSVSADGATPLRYQWRKNGTVLAGATNSTLTFANVVTTNTGGYSVVITNGFGSVTSAVATLTVLTNSTSVPLGVGLDTPNWTWTTSGTPPWFGQTLTSHDGTNAAQSGAIGDDGSTSMQTTVVGPGLLSFWWKVSSLTNRDFLTFYIGSSQQTRISGEVGWQQRTFTIGSGNQTIRWTYSRNDDNPVGQNRGWVDEVILSPLPPSITAQPVGRDVDSGSTVTFNVTATGSAPLSYQWLEDGVSLTDSALIRGATTASLTLSNVQPSQAGLYSVVVSNAVRAVVSSNATLTVATLVPLPEAVDATHLVWTTNGTPPWVGQTGATRDGADAARSGAIGHSQTTSFQTTVTGPGTLSFWWRVSSEPSNDRLLVFRGSTELARISGEVPWQPRSFSIPSGSQILRWSYTKSSSTLGGQDRAWVDQISYVPLVPPAPPEALSATAVAMSRIELAWTDASTMESGFLVERSTNGSAFTQIASLGSNATSFASTGLLASSTYHYRVRAFNAAGNSAYATGAVATTLPFLGARINFQPASAPVPAGYLADGGAAYGDRGNGLFYGWNSTRTSSAVDRNSTLSPDQRFDTYVSSGTSTGTRWEIAVPNGPYNVSLVVGDPGSSSGTHRYSLEGLTAIAGSISSTNRWLSNRLNAVVADGRLSLSNLAGASNNKICFLDIARLGPLLACVPDKTVECGSHWSFDKPTPANDPCGSGAVGFVIASTITNATGPCSLRVTRTWHATDSCGNSNTCSQTVTLVDTTAPALECHPHRTVERDSLWDFDPPSATDLCAGNNLTISVLSTETNQAGSCTGTFSATRTWSASDACGNSNLCTQTITVQDTTPPGLSCAPNRSVEAGSIWNFDRPTLPGEDASLEVLHTTTNAAGPCVGSFAVTRTWSARDACGNSNTCSQTVTVLDTTPPGLSCLPDKSAEAGAWAFDPPALTAPTSPAVTLAILHTTTNSTVHCDGTFVATRTWSATDACGNSNTCSQTVTVIDTTPPELVCPADKSVEAGTGWSFDAPAAPVDFASGTNTALAVLGTTTNTTGFCAGSFSVTRTWSATDACGNSNTCSQSVTVLDTTPPELVCLADKSVEASASWSFDAPARAVDLASGTNTTLAVLATATNTTGFCAGSFSVTRTWRATDACGNSNTCSQTVTVLDTTPPALVCPADKSVEAGTGWSFDGPAPPVDLASGTNTTLALLSTTTNTTGFCAGSFRVTRTWSATDACGNSNACSQTVTVLDTTPPALVCPADKFAEAGTGWSFDGPAPPVDLASGTNTTLAVLSTTTNTTEFCAGTFIVTRTWSATDACGNSNTCSQTILVRDTTPPVPACPANKTVEAGTAWAFDAPTAHDAGSGSNVTLVVVGTLTNSTHFCAGAFEATRTWSVIDACGNASPCSQTVTVLDTTAPTVSCPANKSVEAGFAWSFDLPSAPVDQVSGTNVLLAIIATTTNTAGFCPGTFAATRTWSATDPCGNSNRCSQVITVVDTTPPTLVCADLHTCNPNVLVTPAALDNAGPAPLVTCVREDGQPLGSPFSPGTNSVTCTAVDACTNSATCQFRVILPAVLAVGGPSDQTGCVGDNAVFSAAVLEGEALSVRWHFNGQALDGATNLTLAFSVVSADQAGTYCVEIRSPCSTNAYCATLTITNCAPIHCALTQGYLSAPGAAGLLGGLLSSNLTLGLAGVRSLTIHSNDLATLQARLPARGAPAALPNAGDQSFSTALLPLDDKIRLDSSLLGQTIALALSLRFDPQLAGFPLSEVFCTSTLATGEVRHFALSNSVLIALAAPALGITNSTVGGLLELAQRALAGRPTGGAALTDLTAALGAVTLTFDGCRRIADCPPAVPTAPINDAFASRLILTGTPAGAPSRTILVSGHNVAAGVEGNEPPHAFLPSGRSVWWQFTPVTTGWVHVHTIGSSFDTVLAAYTGDTLSTLVSVASNDDEVGSLMSALSFFATAGTPYHIAVDGYFGDSGNITLTILEGVTP